MIEGRLVTLADRFWAATGGRPAPPRDLASITSRVLPVTIVPLPTLTLTRAEAWLQRRGLRYRATVADRRLHGCLIAKGGHGFLFVDAADPIDEQRFTVAHEVAHYLIERQAPRAEAIRRHGDEIVQVLDGVRSPTVGERISAALIGRDFTFDTHLLQGHDEPGLRAAEAETDADQLAYELLAAAAEIMPLLERHSIDAIHHEVIDRFGLPPDVANRYIHALSHAMSPPSFLDWLGGIQSQS